jgi:hypothetical protein
MLAFWNGLIFCSQIFSQNSQEFSAFSKFSFSLLGGINFSSNASPGPSLQIEVKTNIFRNATLKASAGFSLIKEDADYVIKSYHPTKIEDYDGYQLNTYSINQIQYSVIPINLGLEYIFIDNQFAPFGIFELGYNFYSAEEQIESSGSGEWYDSIDEIPEEYQNPVPNVSDGSTLSLGAGFGVLYKISPSVNLSIRYIYRYQESIINVNQILFGVTF